MKKMIPKLILFIIVIGIIIGGKYFIDYKTYNFRDEVQKGLTDYLITGDEDDLRGILKILDAHSDDEKYRKNLQSYSGDIIGSWFVYIDAKYDCSTNNRNSCQAQSNELTAMQEKLETLYKNKVDNGYTIIAPSTHNNLKDQVTKKITSLNNIINNPGSYDAQNIEELRIQKCNATMECDSCRETTCVCYYTDPATKHREALTCYNKILPEEPIR